MKLNAIKRCCMDKGQFLVFRSPEGRWLSNGSACWPTDGVVIRAEDVRAIFAISRKQMETIIIQEREVDDERLALGAAPHEEELEMRGQVWDDGRLYAILQGRSGVARLIDTAWLKPVENSDEDMRFFLRPGSGGDWVAAFGGLLAEAIVAPESVERAEEIMGRVRELARMRVSEVQADAGEKPGVWAAAEKG